MRPTHEDDSISNLYGASYGGCVSTLNTLIQQDPLILYRISQTAFTETPLHISAVLGHLDFTKALLAHKAQLAQESNSFQRTPLHLASAEGHEVTVLVLLQAYDDACLKPDQDGRIPLHYATMRGRTEVVRELIGAKPESLRVLDRGKTVLHLCVAYNHLETLKALVEEHSDRISEFLNSKDSDGGHTILHLAVLFKQAETIRYLLSIDTIKEEANNNKNSMGLTAIEMVEHSAKDFQSLEIQLIFMNAGIKSERNQQGTHLRPLASTRTSPQRNCCNKFLKCIKNYIHNKGDWLEETRQMLSVVATLIATMTFQVAMNPPGGIIQWGSPSIDINATIPDSAYFDPFHFYYRINSGESQPPVPPPASPRREQDIYPCFLVSGRRACPGEPVLSITSPGSYFFFLVFNTIAFIASLSVSMLFISGIPLKNKFCMWTLSIGMCISLTCLANTYVAGVAMVTLGAHQSDHLLHWYSCIWVGLLALVGVFITVRFLGWIVRLCKNRYKPQMPRAPAI